MVACDTYNIFEEQSNVGSVRRHISLFLPVVTFHFLVVDSYVLEIDTCTSFNKWFFSLEKGTCNRTTKVIWLIAPQKECNLEKIYEPNLYGRW